MLEGIVIPKDESQWRPMNRRLRSSPDVSRKKHDQLAEAQWKEKTWNLPSQKKHR
jgi:hypothetical protein